MAKHRTSGRGNSCPFRHFGYARSLRHSQRSSADVRSSDSVIAPVIRTVRHDRKPPASQSSARSMSAREIPPAPCGCTVRLCTPTRARRSRGNDCWRCRPGSRSPPRRRSFRHHCRHPRHRRRLRSPRELPRRRRQPRPRHPYHVRGPPSHNSRRRRHEHRPRPPATHTSPAGANPGPQQGRQHNRPEQWQRVAPLQRNSKCPRCLLTRRRRRLNQSNPTRRRRSLQRNRPLRQRLMTSQRRPFRRRSPEQTRKPSSAPHLRFPMPGRRMPARPRPLPKLPRCRALKRVATRLRSSANVSGPSPVRGASRI